MFKVGGFDGSTGLSSAEMFNPVLNHWKFIAPMSSRRSSVGVGVVNGLLYAVRKNILPFCLIVLLY